MRSRESIKGLGAMFTAIVNRDAADAEQHAREETARAAAEIMQLLTRP
jgi:hypothetical protein